VVGGQSVRLRQARAATRLVDSGDAGEELWISRRPRDGATVIGGLTSATALVAVVAARRHRLLPAATATALQMSLTLVYWEQMVRYLERERQDPARRQ
jgi:hypothetical protein